MSQAEFEHTTASAPEGVQPSGRKLIIEHHHAGPLSRADRAGQNLAPQAAARLLFVGRTATAEALLRVLQTWPGDRFGADPVAGDGEPSRDETLVLVTVTNQKAALLELRGRPPRAVLVEMDANEESRVRFCSVVHHRLPAALIYAVAANTPTGAYPFHGVLHLPFEPAEVYAALAGAQDEAAGHVLQRGPIRLNTATRTVVTPNGRHHMTPKQCALLQMLMLHANQVVSRSQLMADIWETSYLEDTRTLDVHIRWLRERIEPDPSTPVYLLTERGKGYMLQVG